MKNKYYESFANKYNSKYDGIKFISNSKYYTQTKKLLCKYFPECKCHFEFWKIESQYYASIYTKHNDINCDDLINYILKNIKKDIITNLNKLSYNN